LQNEATLNIYINLKFLKSLKSASAAAHSFLQKGFQEKIAYQFTFFSKKIKKELFTKSTFNADIAKNFKFLLNKSNIFM